MGPAEPIRTKLALRRIQAALGVDQALKPTPEAAVRRPYHDLWVVPGPGSQATDLSPSPGCIAHGPKGPPLPGARATGAGGVSWGVPGVYFAASLRLIVAWLVCSAFASAFWPYG